MYFIVCVLLLIIAVNTDGFNSCLSINTNVLCVYLEDVATAQIEDWRKLTIENNQRPINEILNKKLPTRYFEKAPDLEELTIIGCVSELAQASFLGLPRLKNLTLHYNSITTFGNFTFILDAPLDKLDLKHNNIGSFFDSNIFPFAEIYTIDLSYNKIRGLYIQTLLVGGLQNLYITNNEISRIEDYAIFTPFLKKLDLSHNILYHIEERSLVDMTLLKHLNLSHNKFENFTTSFNLQNLETLDLSHNHLNLIGAQTFKHMSVLNSIHLNHNQLKSLTPEAFSAQKVLNILHLHHNFLQDWMFLNTDLKRFIKEISIQQNPWPCDCLDELELFLMSNKIKQTLCDRIYGGDGNFPVCISIASARNRFGVCATQNFTDDLQIKFLGLAEHSKC